MTHASAVFRSDNYLTHLSVDSHHPPLFHWFVENKKKKTTGVTVVDRYRSASGANK
jgi:hypothetical protein